MIVIVIMLSFHFTTALFAANATDPAGLAAKLRFTLRTCMIGGAVGVPLVILAANPLMQVFGAQYAALAAVPLALMVGSYFGAMLKAHYIALLRIHDQLTKASVYATVTCVIRVAAMVAGALAGGLVGVSVALLVTMTAEGLYAIPAIRRALKASDSPAPAPLVTGRPGGRRGRPAAAGRRSSLTWTNLTQTETLRWSALSPSGPGGGRGRWT